MKDYNIMTVETFDYDKLSKTKVLTQKRGSDVNYVIDNVNAFDIETTGLKDIEQSVMYVWQWHFDGIGTVIGRTWEEFNEFKENLLDKVLLKNTNKPKKLITYVHNLSYEFQFLAGIYEFIPEEVFAVKSRKILKCNMNELLEFRCSYLKSNMNLDRYTERYNAKHKKITEERAKKLGLEKFDYKVKRYPWSELTEDEMIYILNDVVGLVEALKEELRLNEDTLITTPMTSTGYVRREARKVLFKKGSPRLTLEDYELCREAFRGGDTHANRYYVDTLLKGKRGENPGEVIDGISSKDISSSYPFTLCCRKFPMGPFKPISTYDIDDIEKRIERGRAVIMRVALKEVEIKDQMEGSPYLSQSKCRKLKGAVLDNGRILKADYLETTITDVDYKIILEQYSFYISIIEAKYARYDYLPKEFRDLVIDYYTKKTTLKAPIPNETKEQKEYREYLYARNKELLNALYGMMAQDILKAEAVFNPEALKSTEVFKAQKKTIDEIEEALGKASRFLSYAWGVWTTAWSRYSLFCGRKCAGTDFVYCDTDSVKYLGDHEKEFEKLNEKLKELAEEAGAYADDTAGVRHFMGVFEDDGTYLEFKTLGAKKYAYKSLDFNKKTKEFEEGVHITIAGVPKKSGAEQLGEVDNLESGFIFTDKNLTKYNDLNYGKYEIDGHIINVTRNIYIDDTTYELALGDKAGDYAALVHKCNKIIEYMGEDLFYRG